MCLARFFADWCEAKHGANALDNGGFTRTASTNEHVQIGIEANAYAIEESPFPV